VSESCKLVKSQRAGWWALTLSNGCIEVTVLPDKGCEIYEFRDRSTGVDVLFKAPWGLQPQGAPPREGWGGMQFLARITALSCRSTARLRSPPGRSTSAPRATTSSSWSAARAARAPRSHSSGACASSAGRQR
jgi:hypothetical protein